MSELIDREAVREFIKSYRNSTDVAFHMEDHLDEIPAASPWHRVDDEMPDLLQFVLVCNDEGKCVVAQYVGYQTDSATPWRIAYSMYDTDAYLEADEGPVCYWMPLPKPPQEVPVDDEKGT